MKKIVALLVVAMLAVLTACSQPNTNSTSSGTSTSTGGSADNQGISILTDKTFSKGLGLRGLGGAIYKDKAS